jgi:Ca2+-binding EF-hand superfamily protein
MDQDESSDEIRLMHEIVEQWATFDAVGGLEKDTLELGEEKIKELARRMGSPLDNKDDFDAAMVIMDTNGDGHVTIYEYEAWWIAKEQRQASPAGEFTALVTATNDAGAREIDPDDDPLLKSRLGANAAAYKMFCELDDDGSGGLDEEELFNLTKRMGLLRSSSRKKIKKIFKELERHDAGEPQGYVTFESFAGWYNTTQERLRKAKVRQVKELFSLMDKDDSGRLSKQEFGAFAIKAQLGLDPPFDLDTDWAKCRKVKESLDEAEEELNYNSFEMWWRERLGISSPSLPVLPEHIVTTVEEAARTDHRQRAAAAKKEGKEYTEYKWGQGEPGVTRAGKELWALLRPRLLTLVRSQQQWGDIHDIYDSVSESRFETTAIPRNIRDPDSTFSACWDLAQVFLLLYVAVTVPLRAGFELEVDLWSSECSLPAAVVHRRS